MIGCLASRQLRDLASQFEAEVAQLPEPSATLVKNRMALLLDESLASWEQTLQQLLAPGLEAESSE